jgi:hypothetical protein
MIDHRWVTLAACCMAILAIWGWLLPAIGARGQVRESIESLDRRGINSAAIFYTDVFPSRHSPGRDAFFNNR